MRWFFNKFFSIGTSSENVRMEVEPGSQGAPVDILEHNNLGGTAKQDKTADGEQKKKAGSEARQDFYGFNKLLEEGRPDNVSSRSTNLYIEDLNLYDELHGLDKKAVVVDVGSSYSKGTEGLKEKPEFSDYTIVGVTPRVFDRRAGNPYTIPVLEGTAESLPTVLEKNNIGEADVILLRNVMEEIYLGEKEFGADGLVDDSLQGLYDALKPGGKVLIYDQYGTGERDDIKFYQEYKTIAQKLGFTVEEIACPPRTQYKDRLSPNYLKLTKENPVSVSEDEPISDETKDRQFYLASPDHFVFNPGHTESAEIKALSLTLVAEGAATLVTEGGKTYIVLDMNKLPSYLAAHQEDQPHAVADICTLVSEELKQFVSPKRSIKDMKELEEELVDADDADLKDDLEFLHEDLRTTLSVVPGQQMATCGLVSNPEFQSLFLAYVDRYGEVKRSIRGTETDQTYGAYLNGVLDIIKTNLRTQREQILGCLDEIDFLQQHQLPLPSTEKLQAVSI